MTRLSSIGRTLPLSAMAFMLLPATLDAQEYEGPYIVAEGGIGILKTKGTTLAGPFSHSDDSGVFGGALGYRTQLGADSRFVLGAEGNIGVYSDGSNARYGIYGIGGFQVGDTGLLYGRLGYSWLNGIQTGIGKGIEGFTVGGGYEVPIANNMNVRLDYKYIDYNNVDVPDNQIDFKGHEILAGFVLKF